MGMSGSGGAVIDTSVKYKNEKLEKSLVVEDIKIIERIVEVPVPVLKYIEQDQIKLKDVEREQIKFVTKEEINIKYVPKELETLKYNVKEEITTRYIPQDKSCERPILFEKVYEKPVIKETEIEVFKVTDIEAVRQLASTVPELIKEVKALSDELETLRISMNNLRSYKLIEEEIKVPNINDAALVEAEASMLPELLLIVIPPFTLSFTVGVIPIPTSPALVILIASTGVAEPSGETINLKRVGISVVPGVPSTSAAI